MFCIGLDIRGDKDMKRTGPKKTLGMITLIIIVLALAAGIPIKQGVSEEESKARVENSNTYICEQIATTGPSWLIYKEEADKQGAMLEGKLPIDEIDENTFFYSAHNRFLITGEKVGVRIVDEEGNIENYYGEDAEAAIKTIQERDGRYEYYDIFCVEEWDIITPIQRGSIFSAVAPESYLNLFDFF